MRMKTFYSVFFIILFMQTRLAAVQLPPYSTLDSAWAMLGENKIMQAEQLFQQAVKENNRDVRPYLALSYLMQLIEKNDEAWNYYEKSLYRVPDPYPYIFAAIMTGRGELLANEEQQEDRGLMKWMPRLCEKADSAGILRAGALEILGRYEQDYDDIDDAIEYFNRQNAIEKWTLAGPFENISASGFDKVFEPEEKFDPESKMSGKIGIPVEWFDVDKIRLDKWIDMQRYFPQDESVFYGNVFFYSPLKQSAQIRVGTSGSVKTFLNDEKIISVFDENNNDLDTYIAETDIQEGWNRLLIKIGYSEINSCNFLVRITDRAGYPIKGIKYSTAVQTYPVKPGAKVKIIKNFAEDFFQKQIEKFPGHIENYLLLADCYLRNDKAIEAELVLRKAEKMMPNSVLIKRHLLEAYLRGEKNDEAISTVSRIFDLYPDIPMIIENKYNEYLKNENYAKAEEMLDRYEKLRPGSAKSYILRIPLLLKNGKNREGYSLLEKGYKEYPTDWDLAYLSSLYSYQKTQKYDESISILEDFWDEKHMDFVYPQLAKAYLNAGELKKFIDLYEEIIERNPSATGVYYTMADVYFKIQNYQKARDYINQCLKLSPNNTLYWSSLAEIEQAYGNKIKAIHDYKTALEYEPTNFDVINRLRDLNGQKSVYDQFDSEDVNKLINNSPGADKYPNDDAVYLLDDMKRVVYFPGASEVQKEILVKVFNSNGIDDFKEYWISYNGYSQKLIVDKAVVVKNGGSEIKADINSNHLVFKSIDINDIIHIKYRIQSYYRGRLSKHIWEEVNFNYFYPVEKVNYSILVPRGFKFEHKTQFMPDARRVKTIRDGLIYKWSMADQPAIVPLYNMPRLNDIGKMLFISSIPDWNYLYGWYQDLAGTKSRSSYEIKEKVNELLSTKPEATELEKIALIQNFITENIRYSSVSFRQSGLIPQKAREVLIEKIGDCKDVATLCIAMLKEVGIPAHYVLVNTFDKGLNRNILPAIDFNHAIVGVETQKGTIYLDLTAQNYPLYTVPSVDMDAFAFSILPSSKEPFYLGRDNFAPGVGRINTEVTFAEDNSAHVERKSYRWGQPATNRRYVYRFKGEEDQRKELTQSLAKSYPNVQLDKFELIDLDEIKLELQYNYDFNVPFYLVDAGNMKLFKIPWSDYMEARKSLSTEERKFDYNFRAITDTSIEDITILLPKGYIPAEFKKHKTIKFGQSEYRVDLKYQKGEIIGRRTFIDKLNVIPEDDYPAFRDFYNQVVREDDRQFLLKKQ